MNPSYFYRLCSLSEICWGRDCQGGWQWAESGEMGAGSWERYLRAEKRRNSRIYIEAVGGDGRRAPSVSEKETHSYRV